MAVEENKNKGLKIVPDELFLNAPYNTEKWAKFSVINESSKNHVFKIKSTGPDRIQVSPSCGFIRAFDRCEVLVTLAGNCVDPMIRSKEKFLIQSAVTSVPSSVWADTSPRQELRNAEPSALAEMKLLLRFLPTMKKEAAILKELENSIKPVSTLPEEASKRGNEFHNGNKLLDHDDEAGVVISNSSSSLVHPDEVSLFEEKKMKGDKFPSLAEDVKELKDRVTALEQSNLLPRKRATATDDEKKDTRTISVASTTTTNHNLHLTLAVVAGALLGLTVAKKQPGLLF